MSKHRIEKEFDELCYNDDFMFGKVMEDLSLCHDVLECLLQRPVGELTESKTQREVRNSADGKPIRLDIYNEDDSGAIFDTEMQNLNHKKPEDLELPRRSRYYQGSMDSDYLKKKNSYKKLPESSVLFICTFDPFRKGLSQYTFRERCDEDTDITLNDGTEKIFFNCLYTGNNIPDELRKLYDYMNTGKADSTLTARINDAVEKGRKNETWRAQYMREVVVLQDARDEGLDEGIRAFIMEKIDDGIEPDIIIQKLKKYYHLSTEEAQGYVTRMRETLS